MYLTIGKSPLHLLLALVVALIVASAAFILLVEDVLTLQHPRPVAAVCILRLSGLSFVLGATYLIQRLVCKMRKWMVRSAALHLRRRPLRSFLIPGAPLDSLAFHENSLVWSSEFTHWKGNKWFFGGKMQRVLVLDLWWICRYICRGDILCIFSDSVIVLQRDWFMSNRDLDWENEMQ